MYLWSFIKKQTSGTSNDNDDDEWYNEWQRMTTSDNECYNEWQPVVQWVTMSDNEWQWVIENDSEWQRMTASDKTNENEWESVKGVILSFKMKEKANLVPEQFYSIFYLMCKYYMFSNIDNL